MDYKIIEKVIKSNADRNNEMEIRRKYYASEHIPAELLLPRKDGRPKTISITNMVKYATSFYCGYILKNNVKYLSRYPDSNDESLDNLDIIYDNSNIKNNDLMNFKNALLYGFGIETANIENGEIYFTSHNPKDWYFVFDDKNKIVFAFSKIKLSENTFFNGEILDKETTIYYLYDADKITVLDNNFKTISSQEHFFGQIPVIVYKINNESSSFFDNAVLNHIDQLDILSSTVCDDVKFSCDSFLRVSGIDPKGLMQKDNDGLMVMQKLKDVGILGLPEGGSADFIFRKIDTDKFRFAITNAREEIYRMLSLPDLVDKMNGHVALNSISGVALKLMFQPMEQKASEFCNYLLDGYKKRIELINRYNILLDKPILQDIDIKFSFNLPENNIELMQNINTLATLMSAKDRLSLLPFIDNAEIVHYNKQLEKESEKEELSK
jgi:SPP1 family phage portal protein